jgi:transposase
VIDYETFARIHDCRDRQGLTIIQIARTLGLNRKTVVKWLARRRYAPQQRHPRNSILDPFKGRITRLLDTHPYSAQQIFQRLREEGYRGRRHDLARLRWPHSADQAARLSQAALRPWRVRATGEPLALPQ